MFADLIAINKNSRKVSVKITLINNQIGLKNESKPNKIGNGNNYLPITCPTVRMNGV